MLVVFLTVSRGEPGAAEAGHAGCAQMHCSCCACTLMRLDVPHRWVSGRFTDKRICGY